MTKEQFEQRIRELIPNASDKAMEKWLEYAGELSQDGTETASEFFDRSYVELFLVNRDHGAETTAALFNYGEDFTFNYFELRGAATLLSDGWSLERISDLAMEDGCDATPEELAESAEALRCFRSGQWEIQENKQRFHTDLAYSARQLFALEKELGGQEGVFAEWLRAAYELNEDFERPFAEEVNDICSAFRESEQQYGREGAQQIYNTLAVILPTEIQNAAQYLHLGGKLEHVPELASVGFLMGSTDDVSAARAVEYMNAGGEAAYAYTALRETSPSDPEPASPQCQQFV